MFETINLNIPFVLLFRVESFWKTLSMQINQGSDLDRLRFSLCDINYVSEYILY